MKESSKRIMDPQGRVLIPPHIRKDLGMGPGSIVNIEQEGNSIRLTPAEARCCLCGTKITGSAPIVVTVGPVKRMMCRSCCTAAGYAAKLAEEERK